MVKRTAQPPGSSAKRGKLRLPPAVTGNLKDDLAAALGDQHLELAQKLFLLKNAYCSFFDVDGAMAPPRQSTRLQLRKAEVIRRAAEILRADGAVTFANHMLGFADGMVEEAKDIKAGGRRLATVEMFIELIAIVCHEHNLLFEQVEHGPADKVLRLLLPAVRAHLGFQGRRKYLRLGAVVQKKPFNFRLTFGDGGLTLEVLSPVRESA